MNLLPSIHQRLLHQHEAIMPIISGKSKERMIYRPSPGKWNIHDNIVHLVKYQPVFIERIHLILTTETPQIGRYRAEDDPEFETWRSWSTNKLFEKLNHHREKIVELAESLTPAQLDRI